MNLKLIYECGEFCTGNFCKDYTIEKLDEENIHEPRRDRRTK